VSHDPTVTAGAFNKRVDDGDLLIWAAGDELL